MTEIIRASNRFALRKCRPGSLAMHREHGIVQVIHAQNAIRTIEVEYVDMIDGEEMRRVSTLDVGLMDLLELDPFVDLYRPLDSVVLPVDFSAPLS